MQTKKIAGIFTIIMVACATALTLAACDNTYGVFHEIQTEKEQVGTDIFKNAAVKAIGDDGTNYYAVMAKVYARDMADDADPWSVLSVNGDSDYYCAGFASDGAGAIYVAATNPSTSALKGVFKGTVGGGTWAGITTTAIGTGTLDGLFWAGTTLFALAHSGTGDEIKYSLYYSDGTAAFAATGPADLSIPIRGIVYDGATYWAITASKVYSGAENALATDSTPAGGGTLAGIAVDHNNFLLVTTGGGDLYTNDGAWSSKVVSADVELGVIAEVPTDNAAPPGGYRLLIAKYSADYGYYEYDAIAADAINGDDDAAVYAPTPSSYTTTIYKKPVQAIHCSSDGKTLLIGLAAGGTGTYALYSNTYSGGAWSGWTAE